ncbi:DUF2946 domain-containing protein [Tepidimonas sp.]|uniref:DUF2946 domain-containing protein n=1 Tax=Tepidimonas sp. TaxID=2002775 RepID=UPI002FE3CB7D
MSLRRLRWPHWLALIAVLWATLSPALARVALPVAQEGIEICTSTGVVRLSVPGADTAPGQGAAAMPGCDWCLHLGGLPALPASALFWWAAVAAPVRPSEAQAAFPLAPRWVRPSPRGPPATFLL